MDQKLLELLNLFYLVSFVSLVSLAIVRIGKRYIDYKRAGLGIPLLLKRDFFFFSGLVLPFISLLTFRTLGISPVGASWYPLWILASGGLALFGTAYWVYVEYFKIED